MALSCQFAQRAFIIQGPEPAPAGAPLDEMRGAINTHARMGSSAIRHRINTHARAGSQARAAALSLLGRPGCHVHKSAKCAASGGRRALERPQWALETPRWALERPLRGVCFAAAPQASASKRGCGILRGRQTGRHLARVYPCCNRTLQEPSPTARSNCALLPTCMLPHSALES
jgi:hypothetical protein